MKSNKPSGISLFCGAVIIALILSPGLKAQTLDDFINLTEGANPRIQAYELRYDIASEKVNEAQVLGPTELGAAYFVSEPETRTGAQKFRLSARQMFPWFGTITSRENYAEAMAEAEYEELVIIRRKLALEVTQVYYTIQQLQAKRAVLEEHISLLQQYEALAIQAVEVDKAGAADVLRLQIRENDLVRELEILKEKLKAEKAMLNSLADRSTGTEVRIEAYEVMIPEIERDASFDLELHPELVKYDKLYNSVEQAEMLNQKQNTPNFGIGLDYINVQERPDMTFDDNGKDILMPMVSFSIPIFNEKFSSVSRQNELKKREIEAQRSERLNELNARLFKAIAEQNAARITFESLEANIGKAEDTKKILLTKYETGELDFTELLEIESLQLRLEIAQVEAVLSFYLQTAFIQYLSYNS
ncbi:TolC family protein [Robertkochia aurantiaca]|uniref:TolC family protein n=1 Tax=Robertkochia aurantiaca TaxID=2873700 RepID=UPI001CCE38B1|nr:TolC family protein [Robertkochia sp. 3YJGBD-33]